MLALSFWIGLSVVIFTGFAVVVIYHSRSQRQFKQRQDAELLRLSTSRPRCGRSCDKCRKLPTVGDA